MRSTPDNTAGAQAQDALPWWQVKRRERGRPREYVTQQLIVKGALELLTSSGLDGLSMRKLAAHLGVSPATIVWWVGSRDNLLALVVDNVFGEVELRDRPTGQPWHEELRDAAEQVYTTLSAYPTLVPAIMGGSLAGPNSLRVVDRMLTILLEAGFDSTEIERIHGAITFLTFGFVSAILNATPGGVANQWTAGHGLKGLPADVYPALVGLADAFQGQPDRDGFRFAVDSLLTGVAVRRPKIGVRPTRER